MKAEKVAKNLQRDKHTLAKTGIPSFLPIAIFACIMAIVFYSPYPKGLYFENDLLPVEIVVFVLFSLFCINKLLNKDKIIIFSPIDYASFALILVYFISIIGAASLRLAIAEWLKYCMYLAVFIMLSDLLNSKNRKIIVLWVVVSSALGVALLGLDGIAGERIAKGINKVFYRLDINLEIQHALFNGRIQSTITYANSLAAYFLASLFICIGLTLITNKVYLKALAGAIAFVIATTIVLTLSKGVMILFPVAVIIYILVLPGRYRVQYALLTLAFSIPGAVASYKLFEIMQNPAGHEVQVWVITGAGAISASLITILFYFCTRLLEKINWKVYIAFLVVIIAVMFTGSLFLINSSIPLELSHSAEQDDSNKTIRKSVVLSPSREYRLVYNVDALNDDGQPYAYSIKIYNETVENILFGGNVLLAADEVTKTNGIEEKSISFKVPGESRCIVIQFINTYKNTKAVFHSAEIVDISSGKTTKRLILDYKYIPDSLAARFEGLEANSSTVSRSIFYKDGIRIFKDHWFVGAGGNAWSVLYSSYQSYLYWSTQAHNYILQLAIETGIIGLIVFFALIFAIIVVFVINRYIKKESSSDDLIIYTSIITALFSVFAHSVIDFDLSIPAIYLLVWVAISILNALFRDKLINISVAKGQNRVSRFLENLFKLTQGFKKLSISPFIGSTASILFLILPIMFFAAIKCYEKGTPEEVRINGRAYALEKLKQATKLDPFSARYKIDYAKLILDDEGISQEEYLEAREYYFEAEKYSRNDANLLTEIGVFYLSKGIVDKGLACIDRAVMLAPLDINKWDAKLSAYGQLATLYYQKGDKDNTIKYLDDALRIISDVKAVNDRSIGSFVFSDKMIEMLEKCKYLKDSMDAGEDPRIDELEFYYVTDLDVDSDNKPDQWRVSNNSGSVALKDGMVVAENFTEKDVYLLSRNLSLMSDKTYSIEVELANNTGINSIPFKISGVSAEVGELTLDGGKFTSVISTPNDFAGGKNYLYLGIKGKYEIKNVVIREI